MIAATFIKYIFVTANILYLLGAFASSSDLKTHKELIDYLYKRGYIKSLSVKEKMGLVDRRFFVNSNPYEDSSQPGEHGAIVGAPHTHARILESLKDHMTDGAKVSCILCDTGYLLACMGLFVTVKGGVIGVQMDYALTLLNYDNLGTWSGSTAGLRQIGYKRDVPFLLYTRGSTTENVPGEGLSAIHYRGDDKNTIEVLGKRLKPGGRLIYERNTGRGDPELMVIDKLQNGSLSEKQLIDTTLESGKKEEEEDKEREGEEFGGLEDLFPPRPVLSGFRLFSGTNQRSHLRLNTGLSGYKASS
uniref:protein-L-isoaspartate(D-aspartate) O-methyltransferase n=1 Tax=Trichobilharzia regenti TaxID=157069 RepID=A0AA85ISL8_TRIRE|nr:unnamed protein product [Trichobilharzia regenti]